MAPGLIRASADGRLFALRNGVGGEPHSCTTIALRGRRATVYPAYLSPSLLSPAPDGHVIYAFNGIYTPQLELSFPTPALRYNWTPFLPAEQGDFFMRLDARDGAGAISFYAPDGRMPFAQLKGVEGVRGEDISHGKPSDRLAHDKRVHLIPDAKLLVSIPESNDRLVLYRFDLEAELVRTGKPYLYVGSQPPLFARKGQTWSYKPAVRSSAGGVKLKLADGPPGMALKEGVLTWAVPSAFAEEEVRVLLTVENQAGGASLHPFTVRVGP
jgi:hypothetical protein